jgi:hypothetical protein
LKNFVSLVDERRQTAERLGVGGEWQEADMDVSVPPCPDKPDASHPD